MRRKRSSNEPSTAPRIVPMIKPARCECDDLPPIGNGEEGDRGEEEDGSGVTVEGGTDTEEGVAEIDESTVGATLVGKGLDGLDGEGAGDDTPP
jgi:hypothetical protein